MNVRYRGFTLVELMIAMAVMGVVITIGVVSLNKFGSTQKMEETRDGLVASLRMARTYAVTGQSVGGVTDLKYVTFSVESDGSVKIFPNNLDTVTYLSKDISTDGVVIGVGTSLRFASYDGKLVDVDGNSMNSGIGFTILAGSGIEDPGGIGLTVKVSSAGLINE
jgi:prepilin-type N-terminal cleavage/methylation domain-containing protein